MYNKLANKKTAKKLIVGGIMGCIIAALLFFAILLPFYNKVNECVSGVAVCQDSFTTAVHAEVRLVQLLMLVSFVAIIGGVMIMFAVGIQGRPLAETQAGQPQRPKSLRRQGIKALVGVAAFFIGGSIASIIIVNLVPVLFPHKSTGQQGRIFAYLIILFYPLVGALAAYLTSKWTREKLR